MGEVEGRQKCSLLIYCHTNKETKVECVPDPLTPHPAKYNTYSPPLLIAPLVLITRVCITLPLQ